MSNHAPQDSRSDPPGLRSLEPSGSQIGPHPMQQELVCLEGALRLGALEIGEVEQWSERNTAILELSIVPMSNARLLQAASSPAAAYGLPAEGPLKRRDGSSCSSTLTPLLGQGILAH